MDLSNIVDWYATLKVRTNQKGHVFWGSYMK